MDAVIGLKEGSPVLAFEVAKLLQKPLFIHRGDDLIQLHSDENPFRAKFDCPSESAPPKNAVLVDDSITGGSKAIEAAKCFTDLGGRIDTCAVVFEVRGKDGSAQLKERGVRVLKCADFDPKSGKVIIQ